MKAYTNGELQPGMGNKLIAAATIIFINENNEHMVKKTIRVPGAITFVQAGLEAIHLAQKDMWNVWQERYHGRKIVFQIHTDSRDVYEYLFGRDALHTGTVSPVDFSQIGSTREGLDNTTRILRKMMREGKKFADMGNITCCNLILSNVNSETRHSDPLQRLFPTERNIRMQEAIHSTRDFLNNLNVTYNERRRLVRFLGTYQQC